MTRERRLTRSRTDRVISGVCGGIGEYLEVDPILVRLGFVLLALAGGGGILLYIILALILPSADAPEASASETVRRGAEEMSERARDVAADARSEGSGRNTLGLILIALGAFFLLLNAGFLSPRWLRPDLLWPLILIALGALLLWRTRRS